MKKVNGGILRANLNLLFWLSLIPFTTAWMGDHGFVGPLVAQLLYVVVAVTWIMPDMRIEWLLEKEE